MEAASIKTMKLEVAETFKEVFAEKLRLGVVVREEIERRIVGHKEFMRRHLRFRVWHWLKGRQLLPDPLDLTRQVAAETIVSQRKRIAELEAKLKELGEKSP
jgi:BMFP domain-containing protein YqiC